MGKPRTHDLERRRLADLLGDIRCGLLTTIADDGSLWSLPIFTQQASPDGELWLFTRLGSPLANELRRHQRVIVCYSHPTEGRHVWVKGTSELLFDQEKASELWDPSYEKWLPGGPHDPSLVLVRVAVEDAEYCDAPSATWPLKRDTPGWVPTRVTTRSTTPSSNCCQRGGQ